MKKNTEDIPEAHRELLELGAWWIRRDDIIRRAVAAGVPITTVHEVLGIARTTVYRIIDRAELQ